MTIGLPELAARLSIHQFGPEQDRAARLAVCHAMADEPVEEIREVLEALALMPGDEIKRDGLGPDLTKLSAREPTCTPASPKIWVD